MTTKKTPAKKKATKKPAASKKPTAKKKTTAAKKPAAPAEPAKVFKEIKSWSDCKGQVIRVKHPLLGEKPWHKAKVLHVNTSEGTALVAVATDGIKGRYLLPLDSTVARVK
jgi:hypothetical protein